MKKYEVAYVHESSAWGESGKGYGGSDIIGGTFEYSGELPRSELVGGMVEIPMVDVKCKTGKTVWVFCHSAVVREIK